MDARVERHHRLSEGALRRRRLIVWLGALFGLAGCLSDRAAYESTLPGTSSAASVEWLGERAGYLDVRVQTAGRELRFFVPDARADCAALRSGEGEIRYVNSGLLGRLDRGELRCEPVGILSLEEWRDRRPRGSREPVPRTRSTWTVIYRDAEVVLARGRFGLAGQLGWVGGADTVAVFAVDPECADVIDRGVGSLEYRHAGGDVLAIVGERRRCPLLGLARPLP